jgi:hypothetical protein
VPSGVVDTQAWRGADVAYYEYFIALSDLLIGNLTLGNNIARFLINNEEPGEVAWYLYNSTLKIQSTGLLACDDIQNSPWVDHPADYVSAFTTPSPNVIAIGTEVYSEVFRNIFSTEPWMCRNRTLLRDIKDLANNITISLLGSPDMTNNNTVFKTIESSNTQNYYLYGPLYLLLPYGIALPLAAIAASFGLYSIHLNGVSHSMNFSAIVVTTRNTDLDLLTRGASLGAEPFKTDINKVKLRFGPLLTSNSKGILDKTSWKEQQDGGTHIAFGFEDHVGVLKRGGKYI